MTIRYIALLFLLLAGLASSSSRGPQPRQPLHVGQPTQPVDLTPAYQGPKAPLAESMNLELALGIWEANFGSVKIERDSTQGKLGLMGVWVYDKSGSEVIGYFEGRLNGNILEFDWSEPSEGGILRGKGHIRFEPDGRRFVGPWWSEDGKRTGEFRANKLVE